MSLDRDATPVGKWRQVTKPLKNWDDCVGWLEHIEKQGDSDAKIMRLGDELGRPAWAVFAKLKAKQKVGRRSVKK